MPGDESSRRSFLIRVGVAVAALLGFVGWCVWILLDVSDLRHEVEQRVHWMQVVRRVESSLQAQDAPGRRAAIAELDAEFPGLTAAARDDPALKAALEATLAELQTLEQPAQDPLVSADGLSAITPALRRQTAARSVELGRYWNALYVLVAVSVLLSATALALYIRAHNQQVRRAEHEAARLHARLLRSDRLAALGTLAATVAHEINNPLAFVLSNLEVLEDSVRGGSTSPDVTTSLEQAREGVRRVARIVSDLRSMSHPGRTQDRRRLDVHQSLEAAMRICEGEARTRARLVRAFGRNVPQVWADEAQLGQVFLNLLVNAIQAIDPGKPNENSITVRTRKIREGVSIEIDDTGPGIDPRYVDRLFEPFVTTKEVGEGTGLGLYVCQSIVESMHGRIQLEPMREGGTRATITLPVAPPTEERGNTSIPIHAPTPTEGQHLRILIVDDEEMLASALARSLKHHDVQTANRGAAAVELAKETRFDLVLCDLIMPEMSGKEVFEALQALDPTIRKRFVFMTGATVTSEARAFAEQIDAPVLHKPFSRAELLTVLDRFL